MTRLALILPVLPVLPVLSACTTTGALRQQGEDDLARGKVNTVLSSWHLAASQGLYDSYFEQMTDDAVFLGTDASERWTKDEFMSYAREPFADGEGWTYKPVETHIAFSDDRTVAWADEILENEKYGTMRGTGVLELVDGRWKIAHYSLTFLVPNEEAGRVVEVISGSK